MDMYASLFGDCGDAIVIADQQSNILFANEKAQSLFAARPSVLLQPLSDTNRRYQLSTSPKAPPVTPCKRY